MALSGTKKKAVGSLSDPVVLDDSSDENEAKQKPAAKRAKLVASSSHQEKPFSGKRSFLILLLVEPDEDCNRFLEECESLCDPAVQKHCFQQKETLHFTLKDKLNLTHKEAMNISMENDSTTSSLPVMRLTKFTNWPSCVALQTDTSLDSLVSRITPPIKSPSINNLHMSLYRMRGKKGMDGKDGPTSKEKKKEFDDIRKNVTQNFGTAKGVRVVLKETGADYHGRDCKDKGRFFRVLS